LRQLLSDDPLEPTENQMEAFVRLDVPRDSRAPAPYVAEAMVPQAVVSVLAE